MLNREWERNIERLELLLYAGWTIEEILNLTVYIYKSPISQILYPGTSMGKLLISKPINGILNYNQTFSVTPDIEKNKIYMKYLSRKDKNSVDRETMWNYECSSNNLIEKFNEFMEWNIDWK
jgi:hypothetical protein